MTQRIVLLGLDSATWTLLDPWIEAGLLPNLAALRARSAWGDLESTIHPITASAWVTLLTGKNPGKHGIYDFLQRRPGSYGLEVTNATAIKSATIYDLLSDSGKRVVSINMPYTFPPRPVNGKVVGGLFAPAVGPSLTYPASLWEEIKRIAPRYTIAPDYDARAADPLAQYIADMHTSVEERTRVAESLAQSEDWDLFTLIYTECDETQHAFWHCLAGAEIPAHLSDHPARYGNPILELYKHIDAGIGRVLARVPADAQVWVVSDHGGHALKYWVNLNRWLLNEGLLTLSAAQEEGARKRVPLAYSMARAYKRYVPNQARRKISSLLGQRFEKVRAGLQTRLFAEAIAWPQTRAYALGSMGSIYVNLKGREPQGVVEPGAEYEALCRSLIEKLEAWTDPRTGARPIARVCRREELYNGHMSDHAPDLIIIWADLHYCGRGSLGIATTEVVEAVLSSELSDLPLTGVHSYDGIVMVSGAAATGHVDRSKIQDIAPSLLQSFGLPVPADMDGAILPFVQPAGQSLQTVEYQPFSETAGYELSDDEIALVEKRLTDLGYM